MLCAGDLKERQKENTMAHAHAQTPSNKMNENCSPQRCTQSYILLAPLFTDGLAHSCVRLQLLVYDHKTHLSAVTHGPCISHLLLTAICNTIQPARSTACCSHTQAGMHPHALLVWIVGCAGVGKENSVASALRRRSSINLLHPIRLCRNTA